MKSLPIAGFCVFISVASVWSGAPQEKPARQFLNLAGKPKPPGYTHVVTARSGRLVFISGQGGTSRDGKLPARFRNCLAGFSCGAPLHTDATLMKTQNPAMGSDFMLFSWTESYFLFRP